MCVHGCNEKISIVISSESEQNSVKSEFDGNWVTDDDYMAESAESEDYMVEVSDFEEAMIQECIAAVDSVFGNAQSSACDNEAATYNITSSQPHHSFDGSDWEDT